MHIPEHMLNGQICPVTAAAAIVGIGISAYLAVKSKDKPEPMKFAAVAALVFAGQMLNFQVLNGTSGHLLGGTIAVALLGTPFGVLCMATVVAIQALVFSDGGIVAMGANILNMAIIGVVVPGLVMKVMTKKINKTGAIFAAGWISVVAASILCGLEVGISNSVDFGKFMVAMLGVHALIGIAEGGISALTVSIVKTENKSESKKWNGLVPLFSGIVVLILAAPMASSMPDGLEWVADKFIKMHESAPMFVTPFADYSINISQFSSSVQTMIAGFAGVIITFAVSLMISKTVLKQK